MEKKNLKELGVKTLALTGGAVRLALAGIGASVAAFLMLHKARRRHRRQALLPFERIKEALKKGH